MIPNNKRYSLGIFFKNEDNHIEVKPILEDYNNNVEATKEGMALIDHTVKEVLIYDRVTGKVRTIHKSNNL